MNQNYIKKHRYAKVQQPHIDTLIKTKKMNERKEQRRGRQGVIYKKYYKIQIK